MASDPTDWFGKLRVSLLLEQSVVEEAIAGIETLYPAGVTREDMLRMLEIWLKKLEKNALFTLGLPPRKTDKPGVYRFPGDPGKPVSGYADLDASRSPATLRVVKIIIRPLQSGKGGTL